MHLPAATNFCGCRRSRHENSGSMVIRGILAEGPWLVVAKSLFLTSRGCDDQHDQNNTSAGSSESSRHRESCISAHWWLKRYRQHSTAALHLDQANLPVVSAMRTDSSSRRLRSAPLPQGVREIGTCVPGDLRLRW